MSCQPVGGASLTEAVTVPLQIPTPHWPPPSEYPAGHDHVQTLPIEGRDRERVELLLGWYVYGEVSTSSWNV